MSLNSDTLENISGLMCAMDMEAGDRSLQMTGLVRLHTNDGEYVGTISLNTDVESTFLVTAD